MKPGTKTLIFQEVRNKTALLFYLGFGGQEDANFQATAMNGAEAMMGMGMSEQGGMKRHRTKMSSKKSLSKAIRQKKISKKSQLKKNYS